ncbi:MAG: autotransporter-associated beta strand repeat-containing protein [Verrucomicrobiota bacterium]
MITSVLWVAAPLPAQIAVTGVTTPDNSGSFWTNGGDSSTDGVIGSESAVGTLTVENGSVLDLSTVGILSPGGGAVSSASVTGSGSQWNIAGGSSNSFLIGGAGQVTLSVLAGAEVSNGGNAFVGDSSGSSGDVTVSGAGSRWENTNGLRIGNDGDASLTISDGGVVTNSSLVNTNSNGRSVIAFSASSTSMVTVTGAGSQWLNQNASNNPTAIDVGGNGDATLLIEAGGIVSNANGLVARGSNSTSSVTVTGTDSTWTSSGQMNIGVGGVGTLLVEDGGSVISNQSAIAANVGSEGSVTVTGSESSWVTNTMTVANRGDGTLNVENGATVTVNSSANHNIATQGSAVGIVNVIGAGSLVSHSGRVELGLRGTGIVRVSEGGEFATSSGNGIRFGAGGGNGTLQIGVGGVAGIVNVVSVNGTGSVVFDHTDSDYFFTRDGTDAANGVLIQGGSTVTHQGSGQTTFTATSTYTGGTNISGGTLRVTDVGTNASVLGTGEVTVESGGTLAGEGTVLGATEVSGTLSPGNSSGTLRFASDLTLQATSETLIELESLTNFDQIEVDGDITYGGELLIGFLGGYIPVIGDSFQIFDAPNVIGGMTFSDVKFQQDGFTGDFDSGTGTLSITAVPESAATWLIALGAALTLLRRRGRS